MRLDLSWIRLAGASVLVFSATWAQTTELASVAASGAPADGARKTVPRRTAMTEIFDRITVDQEQCGGRPCIRGLRIRVSDVLDVLASGLSPEQILEEMPDFDG